MIELGWRPAGKGCPGHLQRGHWMKRGLCLCKYSRLDIPVPITWHEVTYNTPRQICLLQTQNMSVRKVPKVDLVYFVQLLDECLCSEAYVLSALALLVEPISHPMNIDSPNPAKHRMSKLAVAHHIYCASFDIADILFHIDISTYTSPWNEPSYQSVTVKICRLEASRRSNK